MRFELTERISAAGEVLIPPSEAELRQIREALERERVESVAVCLLHAYAFPQHETLVGDFLRRHLPRVQVSLSCEVLRERKEYERTATTVVNARVEELSKDAKARREAVEKRVAELQAEAQKFVASNVESASGTFESLAERGEKVVKRVRKETAAVTDPGPVKKTTGTTTTAKKAPAKKATAKKAPAKKAAAKTAE